MVALLLPFLFCSAESDSLGGAPVLPREGSSWTDSGRSMDTFYSADGATQWEPVLGDAMHYHHGVFEESELNAKHISDQQACDPPPPLLPSSLARLLAACFFYPSSPFPVAQHVRQVFPRKKMREILLRETTNRSAIVEFMQGGVGACGPSHAQPCREDGAAALSKGRIPN